MITLKSLLLLLLSVEFAWPLQCYDGLVITDFPADDTKVAVKTCDPGHKCAKVNIKIRIRHALTTSVVHFLCIQSECNQKKNCKSLMRELEGQPFQGQPFQGLKITAKLRDCELQCCEEDLCNEDAILRTSTTTSTTTKSIITTTPVKTLSTDKPKLSNMTSTDVENKEHNYSLYYVLIAAISILLFGVLLIANIRFFKKCRRQ